MTLRYRKSIKLGGGIRLNLSKSGIGISCGVPGLRYSINTSGRRTRTVGIPGTGLYWRDDHRAHRPVGARPAPPARARPRPLPHPHKPGLFAPHGEKQLFAAIERGDADAMDDVARADADLRLAAETLSGLHRVGSRPDAARTLLAQVFASQRDPAADPFILRYVTHPFNVRVAVAPGVIVELPLGREAVGLVLAELHHRAGDLDDAIRVVGQLPRDPHVRIALADLYAAAARDEDVIAVTDGVTAQDEAAALLLLLRGIAFHHQGHTDAAREVLGEVFRLRSIDSSIRLRALFERGQCWLADGQLARARHDFERVLADDADYPGLGDALALSQRAPGR